MGERNRERNEKEKEREENERSRKRKSEKRVCFLNPKCGDSDGHIPARHQLL
jgi:hypothetical protein